MMTDARGQMTEPRMTRLTDFQPYPFSVNQVELTFELDPLSTRVTQVSQFERIGDEAVPLSSEWPRSGARVDFDRWHALG